MNKLTWEEFSKNKSFIVLNSDEERALLLKWFKENDYMHLDQAVRGTKMYEGCHSYSNDLNSVSKKERTLYSAYQLEWKKDIAKYTLGFEGRTTPYVPTMKSLVDGYRGFLAMDYQIPERMMFPIQFENDYMGVPIIEELKKLQWNKKKFPKVEILNFNKDKGTTTIKFKNGNVVQSKVNPKETFNEFTGVLVTLLKEVTGMTNQELQGYFKYIMRKEIK